jgi:thymidylate kinase
MGNTGLLISLEGISGTGKTYFTNRLRTILDARSTVFVSELSDRKGAGVDRRIIEVLHHTGDRFCRVGMPLSETFLLLALKMADYEAYIADGLDRGYTGVEDRSIDTVAVYQAVVLSPEDPVGQLEVAQRIYAVGAGWRRPPDVTFLLEDDFECCVFRAEQRTQPPFSADERRLLHGVANLYARYAPHYAERMVRLDRRTMDERGIVSRMGAEIARRRDQA